jgi:hypothetical protein
MSSFIIRLTFAAVAMLALSNCAIGTSKINVGHSPLQPTTPQRSGKIVVKPFTDARSIGDKATIGNKRNGYGMVLGTYAIKGNKSVADAMTDSVADALRAAGYNATVGGSGGPILEGDVYEFWLDLFMATWHNVGLNLTLRDSSGKAVWQKKIDARETNVLWLGVNSEIEKVVRQAVDKALQEAAHEFASDGFAKAAR